MKRLELAAVLLLLCLCCLGTGTEARGSNGISSYRPWKATRASEIVVVGADGQLWGLDGATGAITWQFFTGMPLFSFHYGGDEQEEGAMPFFIPSADGELYTFVDRGLQRVGMTVNDLVAGAPLFADDGSLWLASKELSVWAIDQDGELLRAWSSARGLGTDEEGYQLPLGMELPAETLVVVRADYAIRSIDPATGATKWNMTVGEFVGVERGLAPSLEASNLKVMLTTDGSIFGLNHDKDTYLWMNSLPVPVVAVFDLQQDSEDRDENGGEQGDVWRLHKAAAPALPADLAVNLPVDRSNSVFIGVHDGHVYALPGACSLPQDTSVESDPTAVVSIDSEDDEDFNSNVSDRVDSTAVSVVSPGPAPLLLDEFCTPLSADFPHCIRGHYLISPSANFIEGMRPLLALGDGSNGRAVSESPSDSPADVWLTGVTAASVFVAVVAVGAVIVQRRSSAAAQSTSESVPVSEEDSESGKKEETAADGSSVVAEERKSRLVDLSNGNIRIGNIEITKKVLGYGSGGTIVYEGTLDGRRIAVKRMLASFYVMAEREVALLLQSDEHPHVVRYYTQERDEDFVYLALSFCSMNLEEFVDLAMEQENKRREVAKKDRKNRSRTWRRKPEGYTGGDAGAVETTFPDEGSRDEDGLMRKPKAVFNDEITDELITGLIRQIVDGVAHLHSLQIVHRDLKPQNVLIDPKNVVKISDMGLGKKLEKHQQSFSSKNPGTLGWQAPEILKEGARQTNKVDIFALGCLTFYMLTRGEHPFGPRIARESNILAGQYDLSQLADPLARHLVEAMIVHDPTARLSAEEVDLHPFFWTAEKRLHFLRDASDRLEIERATADVVVAMEDRGPLVIANKEKLRSASTALTAPATRGRRAIPSQALSKRGGPGSYSAAVLPRLAASGSGGNPPADWMRALDGKLREELRTGKFRKYNGQEVRDLLRVIRNKAHHFRDLPADMQAILGPLPGGFVAYFEKRFPHLLLQTYLILKEFCLDEATFKQYFHP